MDRFEHHRMHGFEHYWHPGSYGFGGGPEMLLSMLNTVFWIALFAGLTWAVLKWIIPYIIPLIANIFSMLPANPPALEILRQRYAAGEIDGVTFEQMRERLEASYLSENNYLSSPDNRSLRETWTGYKGIFSPGRETSR